MPFEFFSKRMQELIKEKGFLEPTLPQKIGIPEILSGRNVLIIADTGSGKTEAAVLGLFDMISENREKYKPISILYINPLRALSRDLQERLIWWANKLGLEIAIRHGDVSQSERAIQRECPPDVLVITPESLGAVIVGKKMREHLKNVKFVIVDEIHELVSNKRGAQLTILLERLTELAGSFQRIGISATVGSPELIASFLGENVKIIRAEGNKKYEIKVECPLPIEDQNEFMVGPKTFAKLRRLYELIQQHKSVLIFTNTRETAEIISSRLRSLDKELKQAVHHGSLSKERRIKAEKEFKNEQLKSLVATSSLELGIDIGSIDLVLQYLSPRQVCRLIQRVGRANHHIEKISKGIVLSDGEDLFESAIIASRALRNDLEKTKPIQNATDVLATQIVGLAMEYYDISDDKLYRIIKRAQPYKNLTKTEFLEILKFLEDLHLIWLNPIGTGYKINKRKRAFDYYFSNLSTIPDTQQYRVVSIIQGEPIGNLDAEFVAEHGKPGEKFICSGRAWKIIGIDGQKIIVEPVEDTESAIPAWEGELIPVPFEVAQEVGKLRKFISENLEKDIANKLVKLFNIDLNSAHEMIEIIKKQKASHHVPTPYSWLIENYKDFIIIHSCCGSLVNDTIGRYLAAILTASTGVAVNVKTDPYRIILQTTASVQEIMNALQKADNLEEVLTLSLERSQMFKHRFLQVAKRFGIVEKDADFQTVSITRIIDQYTGTPVYKETLREIFHDKLDIERTKNVLEKIKNKKITLVFQPGLSYLGELGLSYQFGELVKPKLPDQEIFNAFKKRLLATHVRLVCMNCGNYNIVKEVEQVDQQPECPKCNSRLLAVAHKNQNLEVLKKKSKTEEEQKQWQMLIRSADLVITYGKRAVICLAARGVGPENASRILARLHTTEEALFKDILEAEKQFAKTRIYWD